MKKKLLTILLSVLMVFSFAMPAFAEVSSVDFDLDKKSSWHVGSYLNIDSKGSVEFNISNNTAKSWNLKVKLTNPESRKSVEKVLTRDNPSAKFTNLLAYDSYILSVENLDNSSVKFRLNFSFTGEFGGFIN